MTRPETLNSLSQWLTQFRTGNDHAPKDTRLVLVGNKADLLVTHPEAAALQDKRACEWASQHGVDYVYVTATSAEQVNGAVNEIARKVLSTLVVPSVVVSGPGSQEL